VLPEPAWYVQFGAPGAPEVILKDAIWSTAVGEVQPAGAGIFSDQEHKTQDRQERTVSVRQRQEIQEVLRRMNHSRCTPQIYVLQLISRAGVDREKRDRQLSHDGDPASPKRARPNSPPR